MGAPRSWSSSLFGFVLVVAPLGCAPRTSSPGADRTPAGALPALRPTSTPPFPDATASGGPAGSAGGAGDAARGPRFVAATVDGDILVADASSGGAIATAPSDGREVRDLAFEPIASSILAAEFDDAESGQLVALPLLDGALGPRALISEIDGDLRTIASAAGTLTVLDSWPAPRWRWAAATGGDGSAALPLPTSVSVTDDARAAATRVDTLTFGDPAQPELARQAVVGDQDGLTIEPALILGAPAADQAGARLVLVPAFGDAMLVASEAGRVVVRRVDGAIVGDASVVPGLPPAQRVEAAVALRGGRVVVALTNLPPLLVAVGLGATGEVQAGAALELASDVAVADRLFRRDLLGIDDDRVLVATSDGVMGARVGADASLAFDPEFTGVELRGPLALVP